MARKPFIVIEGTDGSGKATQTELLKKRLKSEGIDVADFDFPRYGEDSALLLEAYLNGKLGDEHEVGPYVGSTYFAIDRFHAAKGMHAALDAGKAVISNRYIASNMAHQGQKIEDVNERREYFKWLHTLEFETFGIPKPDLSIVLLVEPAVSQRLVDKKSARTYTEKKRDIHEASIDHLQRSYDVYKQITELYPDDFTLINCTKDGEILPIEEIHNKIWQAYNNFDPAKKTRAQQTTTLPKEGPMAGVYSNKDIKQAVKDGHIVFHPYREEHIAGSSVDVTLGEWYYRTEKTDGTGTYNPFDAHDVERYFDGAHKAMTHSQWAEQNQRKLFKGIPKDHPIIVLEPGERILAHTHEFIGIKPPGTSTMQARSSWGRNGVAVCLDAGWGDPGYINRWTMEIYNMNQHESVVLPVGERIAQLVFYTTGEVESDYTHNSGKYQTFDGYDLDGLVQAWKPQDMLPQSFKDVRELPVEIVGASTTAQALETLPKTQSEDFSEPLVAKLDNGAMIVTEAGKEVLRGAVTDVDGDVYAFTDKFTNPTVAAAMARLSRRGDDMRVTLLDEFAGKAGKDEGLLHRVITAYGDDSVQQLSGTHFVIENASNLLTKKLEWGRLAAYLEQSTRYIFFDQKDAKGNFKYYTPTNLDANTAREYEKVMDDIFKTYSTMVRKLTDYVRKNSKVPKNEQDVAWKGATRAQACDAIRAVLPVSTKSTVGIFASGQAAESLYMHLMSDELQESRDTGEALLKQLREIMPVFFERADKPERGGAAVAYRANTFAAVREIAEKKLPQNLSPPTDDVKMVDYWPKNELDLLPHMLFEHSSLPLEEIEKEVQTWSYDERVNAMRTYMGERLNRRHKPGRALENAHYSWELMCDYGIFRDLQRHRMVDDMNWQQLTPRYGYEVPQLVEEAGLSELYESCFDMSYQLYSAMQEAGYTVEAQYATLLGHKMRWKVTYNAREAFHLHELRTAPQGHPGYRKLVKKMHDNLSNVHPLIADAMIFVNRDEDPELTRLAAEKYTQFKLEQLDKKN